MCLCASRARRARHVAGRSLGEPSALRPNRWITTDAAYEKRLFVGASCLRIPVPRWVVGVGVVVRRYTLSACRGSCPCNGQSYALHCVLPRSEERVKCGRYPRVAILLLETDKPGQIGARLAAPISGSNAVVDHDA